MLKIEIPESLKVGRNEILVSPPMRTTGRSMKSGDKQLREKINKYSVLGETSYG